MSLSDPSTFKVATAHLGVAYASIASTLDLLDSSSALASVGNFRGSVRSSVVTGDVDDNDRLADTARGIELSIPTSIGNSLNSLTAALDTYCLAQDGLGVRALFKDTINDWSDDFRAFWRHGRSEELVVRVGTLTRGVSSWSYAADHTIGLDTAMEIRVVTLDPSSNVVVNLTMTTVSGTNYLATARVPIGATAGTKISLAGGPGKYTGVSSITMSGGTNTDVLEVWLV